MANPNIFLNQTGIIGQAFNGLTNNVTGSVFLTGLLILIVLMVIAFMFRLPLELTVIFLIPIILVFMAFNTGWVAVGGLIFIYIAVILARNFFIR